MKIIGYVPADSAFALCPEHAEEHARENEVGLDDFDGVRFLYAAVFDDSEDAQDFYCDTCVYETVLRQQVERQAKH